MDLSILLSSPLNPLIRNPRRRSRKLYPPFVTMATSGDSISAQSKPPKLVTFIGKGGSGKTTASVLASKYYASEGLRTCLVVHSQDPTVELLMGCRLQNTPTECGTNLFAFKLETSKMILEPLERLKKVDASLNLTQGILERIVGEELGVLPGMDSFAPVLALQNLINLFSKEKESSNKEYDVVVFDGISSEETLRLLGATERARSYLKYVKDLAEKTDIGRLTSPSIIKLVYDAVKMHGRRSEGKTSSEIWSEIEGLIEKTSLWLTNHKNFGCYIVMDVTQLTSVSAALRYWGCAIQAGTHVSGAFGFLPQLSSVEKGASEKFSPLPFSILPLDSSVDSLNSSAKELLRSTSQCKYSSVCFDAKEKLVTLFMPGFDKSEVKLFQYRGGLELLVEVGDQRRIIKLPGNMQGKVAAAKFVDRNLIVKLR
ncbi:P-loop containing nucleoside triphosphate hydrolases superfamily protein [Rhynchospora pubera]|uniref:P-loop containing nucleoside triphosphate hydrolases superfamily protein n=1 Tax=Rhynchospora pubera TaxID=906938 RepID=A0AAV8GXT2_9POAL|nr:P-loop containing nucleoside triphosphate hydrolases superfamily protein [Rhynchospora pubera]